MISPFRPFRYPRLRDQHAILNWLVPLAPATTSVETYLAGQVGALWVGHSVLDTVLKEAEEEAFIPAHFLANLSLTCVVSLCQNEHLIAI